MFQTRSSCGYSADVRIALHINGTQFRVAKMGSDRLYLDAPHVLPASSGEIVMHIDGHERRWRVKLQSTAQPSQVIEAEFSEMPH